MPYLHEAKIVAALSIALSWATRVLADPSLDTTCINYLQAMCSVTPLSRHSISNFFVCECGWVQVVGWIEGV